MTDEDARYPVYRPRAAGSSGPGPGLGLVAIVAGLSYLAADGAVVLAAAGGLVLAVLVAGGYWRARGSATVTGPEGITVRRPPRVRTIAWPDVQVVEIEPQTIWTLQGREPRRAVVVYDARSRRTALPAVDSRQIPELEDEERRLRECWERERGPDWTPVEGLHRRTTDWGGGLLLTGLLLVAVAFCVTVGVIIVRTDGPVLALLLFGVFPVAAMVTTLVILTRRRR